MPEIYRTENPLQYTQLEGVIVTERQPVPSVISAGANNCIFLAQFERGPSNQPTFVTSISELQAVFGDNLAYSGNKALRLKGWSNLYVTRVVASDSVLASWTQIVSGTNLITFTAKEFGAFGNEIQISISEGTDSTPGTPLKKITIVFKNFIETFDNLSLAGKSNQELQEIFRSSKFVNVSDADGTNEPQNVADQNLNSGSDGSVSTSDYSDAIQNSNLSVSGKIYFTDLQTAGIKAALTNFVKTEQAGICIVGPESLDASVPEAVTEANSLLDQSGRVLYAYNPILFNVEGSVEEESPVFMAASILSLVPPHVSPAAARTTQYTQTAVGVKFNMTRSLLIQLRNAGIMSFENDSDLGIKIVSAVTGNPEYSVLRRRMSDFYINSVALFLKNFQDEPNSMVTRAAIKSAIVNFDENLVSNGILPGDAEFADNRSVSIRTEGISTPEERASGILKIEIKRKLFPASSFLILLATIGERVRIEEVA